MKIERQRSHTTNRRGWHFAVTLFCFCSVSEHLPPASSRPTPSQSAAPGQPRPGGSHFQQSWQLFRTDRGRPSLQNPRFRAFRAQNCHFCALFAFGTPVLGHFEHKIEIFVRFCPPKPPFSGISSTKSRFLCSGRRGLASGSITAETLIVNVVFLQITAHASKTQIPHNQIINF